MPGPEYDLGLSIEHDRINVWSNRKGIDTLCAVTGVKRPKPIPWSPCKGYPTPWFRMYLTPPFPLTSDSLQEFAAELRQHGVTVEVK
jgi:hypothetical protein